MYQLLLNSSIQLTSQCTRSLNVVAVIATLFVISPQVFSKESQQVVTFEKIKQQASLIQLAPTQLDFASTYDSFLNQSQRLQGKSIASLMYDLEQFIPQNICQSVAIEGIRTTLENAKEREILVALDKELYAKSPTQKYDGSFQNLTHGKRWYKHWLKSWLLSDIKISDLEEIARYELEKVRVQRRRLSHQHKKSNSRTYLATDKVAIVKAFRKREQIVSERLDSLFGQHKHIAPLKIVESTLPKSFPAPGIYNSQTQEFIYHLQDDTLPEHYMDWLFIHEGLPGHHFQSQISINSPLCQSLPTEALSSVYAEGWGAYVETIGSELGLYRDSSSESYALDWRALRAVRVLIDIGIHYHGWSDQEARKVWMKYIPEQKSIREREIKRIHNWPVQVITYVFGKYKIEQSIKAMQAKGFSLRDIHKGILSLSNKSLSALSFLEQAIRVSNFKQERKNN